MTEAEFLIGCEELGSPLSTDQLERFRAYEALLERWSRRARIVSRGDIGHLKERHFLDSLAFVQFLPPGRILDLGTGGGFPGIPIRLVQEERDLALVESARMKCLFLRHVVDELGLENTEVVHERVEELPVSGGAACEVVTARAVTDLNRLWDWSRPLLKDKGVLVAMKGPGEVAQWRDAGDWEGVAKVEVETVAVPSDRGSRERAIVRVWRSG